MTAQVLPFRRPERLAQSGAVRRLPSRRRFLNEILPAFLVGVMLGWPAALLLIWSVR